MSLPMPDLLTRASCRKVTLEVTTTCWWWPSTFAWKESASQNTQDTSLTSKLERSQCVANLPSYDQWEVCTSHHDEQRRYRYGFNDYHLQHSSDWNSQWDPWKTSSEETKKKKNWVAAAILDLCDKRRELKKKRLEPKGSEKYREVNNKIRRYMKKANETWIGEECIEIEENLRKNNSKRAYQLVKNLTTVKQEKLLLSKIVEENASQKNERYWTDGQNTALSCTITRLMEIRQY